MDRVYKARPGFIVGIEDAQNIGEYLTFKFPQGEITPQELVSLAKDHNSPIHKYFEWDDKKAAKDYRLYQARRLIKSIIIEIDGSDVPAYHNIRLLDSDEPSYMDTLNCMHSPDIWAQVLNRALMEAKNWAERYKTYKELAPIVGAITRTSERISNADKKKEKPRRTKKPHRRSPAQRSS